MYSLDNDRQGIGMRRRRLLRGPGVRMARQKIKWQVNVIVRQAPNLDHVLQQRMGGQPEGRQAYYESVFSRFSSLLASE